MSAPTTGRGRACLTPPPFPQGHYVRSEDVGQTLEVSGLEGSQERLQRRPGLRLRWFAPRPACRDMLPGAMSDLANRRRGLTDGLGQFVVAEPEHVAEQEHSPLGRRQCLQHRRGGGQGADRHRPAGRAHLQDLFKDADRQIKELYKLAGDKGVRSIEDAQALNAKLQEVMAPIKESANKAKTLKKKSEIAASFGFSIEGDWPAGGRASPPAAMFGVKLAF